MMKAFMFLFLAIPSFAGGPKYNFPDPKINDEFVNVYKDISNATKGTVRMSSTTISTATISNLRGVTDGSNACSGCVGEYVESAVLSTQNVGASGQYFDLTSISLTPGDWDVFGVVAYNRNGATFSIVDVEAGISTTSGNSATGLSVGSNWVIDKGALVTSFTWIPLVIPPYRVSISATGTYYFKGFVDAYTLATPVYACRISARRIR